MPQLQLNFPRVFVHTCTSGFEFCLKNTGEQPFGDVRVIITCPLLGLTGHESIIGTLAPGASREGHIEVKPEDVGAPSLMCVVEATMGREIVRMEGVWKRLTIYERPQTNANVSVIIQDIQSHRSEGDKAEYGAIKGDVNITVKDLLPPVPTLNDLIRLELPDDFRTVALQRAAHRDHTEVLRIPAAFLRAYQPASVVHLSVEGESPSADAPPTGWRLCSGDATVILGRSSQDCDLVTRFLPASPENNARSATLSRKHAAIHISPDGQILAEPLGPSAVLHVGKLTAATGVPVAAGEGETIALGPPLSEFRLQCRLHRPAFPRLFRVTNLNDSVASRAIDSRPDVPAWGRVDLDFLDSTPAFWNLVWFHAPVPFGLSADGRLELNSSVFDAVLGYFHHYRGGFWIECTAQMDNAVIVNGTPLEDGDFVPLQDGTLLKIGGADLRLARVR